MILRRIWDHDLAWSFRRSPVTVVAAILTLVCVGAAVFAPWLSPQDPFNLAGLDLNEAFKPPAWMQGGDPSVSSLQITAVTAAAAHRVAVHDPAVAAHPWLEKATRYCLDAIQAMEEHPRV